MLSQHRYRFGMWITGLITVEAMIYLDFGRFVMSK